MNANLNATENFNELVFENRNKQYGAYVLRSTQNDTITRSLILTCLFFGTLVALGVFFSNKKPSETKNRLPIIDTLTYTPVNLEPLKPDLQDKLKIKPNVVQPKANPEGVKQATDQHIVSQDPDPKQSGDPKGTAVDSVAADPKGPVEQKTASVPAKLGSESAHVGVDVEPEFYGNVYNFIRDNLEYPESAIQNGTGGLVMLSFIIEKDGSVGNISILKGLSDGCSQEAIRVVKLMPKWKPGKIKGEPVRTILNLPVHFQLK